MTFFDYRNGEMYAEDLALSAIAERVGTPFYCYSTAAITSAFTAFSEALSGFDATICYALKANSNLAVIRTLAALGAGADVVSVGELRRAMAAGVPPQKIVFSGVGKTRAEIDAALVAGIRQFNVESDAELEALSTVATGRGAVAEIAIRVNPDVDARTHAKITTGKADNKFGIDIDRAPEVYARAAELPGIDAASIAVHIGSQLTDLAPFRTAFGHVADLARRLRDAGHDIRRLDLGGGLGITYQTETPPSPAAYAQTVRDTVGDLGCSLMFEPGRALVGSAGILVTRAIYTKQATARRFAIVDAAMNDLLRPALYDAWHDIRPALEPAPGTPCAPIDIVGPVCETGDTFAVARALPPLAAGDIIVIENAGAYGAVMASAYNTRPPAPEILVKGDKFTIVRARQTVDDLLAQERFADWQPGTGR